jgi:hypothetical protein
VPASHESVIVEDNEEAEDGDNEPPAWELIDCNAILFYVERLSIRAQRQLTAVCTGFRPAHSDAIEDSYWANHCDHCGRMFDDHELHCEPGGAFLPVDEESARNIDVLEVEEPLAAAAIGYSLEPAFVRFCSRS